MLLVFPSQRLLAASGTVEDSITCKPLTGAAVSNRKEVVSTDEKGAFQISDAPGTITARAVGYGRVILDPESSQTERLAPFSPKALSSADIFSHPAKD
jgi:hypothetical protein